MTELPARRNQDIGMAVLPDESKRYYQRLSPEFPVPQKLGLFLVDWNLCIRKKMVWRDRSYMLGLGKSN
jgi:hypothetical protein